MLAPRRIQAHYGVFLKRYGFGCVLERFLGYACRLAGFRGVLCRSLAGGGPYGRLLRLLLCRCVGVLSPPRDRRLYCSRVSLSYVQRIA